MMITKRASRDRRSGERDRRVLEGTVKYRGAFFSVEVHDLSATGAYAVCEFTPCLKDSITLNIDFPHMGGSVMVTGRIRRVGLSSRELQRQGGFGIQFTRFYSGYGKDTLVKHLVA